jgi:ribosomal protein S18 acetylase RimI-like enzyme
MADQFSTRDFAPGDLAAVTAMMARLQDHERQISADRRPGSEIAAGHLSYLLDECSRKQGRVFVAERGGSVVGFIVVMVEHFDEGDLHLYPMYKSFADITDLYVEENHRGRGIAGALLSAAEEHARAMGIERIKLAALSGNEEARAVYLRRGYREYDVTYCRDL